MHLKILFNKILILTIFYFCSLPKIIKEIAEEDKEKLNKKIRQTIAKEEVLKIRPPRLGKHKYEAPPVQVLLTEEMTGSLRKLKVIYIL